jgi:hypothetical protein
MVGISSEMGGDSRGKAKGKGLESRDTQNDLCIEDGSGFHQ